MSQNRSVLLTAAHCVTKREKALDPDDFIVYLGRYKLRNLKEEGSQYRDVCTFHIVCYNFLNEISRNTFCKFFIVHMPVEQFTTKNNTDDFGRAHEFS
jgi:hypothetical protein